MKSGLAWILIRPKLSNRVGPDFEIISSAVEGEHGNSALKSCQWSVVSGQEKMWGGHCPPFSLSVLLGKVPVGAVREPPLQKIKNLYDRHLVELKGRQGALPSLRAGLPLLDRGWAVARGWPAALGCTAARGCPAGRTWAIGRAGPGGRDCAVGPG